jgi:hypothetical protein
VTKRYGNEKCIINTGHFDYHADAQVQHGAHPPMAHTQGFARCHWVLPPDKYLRCIAPADIMVVAVDVSLQ